MKLIKLNMNSGWSKKVAIVMAPLMSSALFVVMGLMIFQDANLTKPKTENLQISFLRNYQETQVENMERKRPEKPEEIKPPDTPPVSVAQAVKQQVTKNIAQAQFEQTFDTAGGPGLAIGGVFGASASAGSADNRGLIPLVRVQCEPPRKARMEGIKGQITLRYDVNTNGMVENVQVVNSNPPRVFDLNCIKALNQWRFKPKMVDGKAMAVRGNQRTFVIDYSGASN